MLHIRHIDHRRDNRDVVRINLASADPVVIDLPPPRTRTTPLVLAKARITELEAENDRLKLIIERFLTSMDKAVKEAGEALCE